MNISDTIEKYRGKLDHLDLELLLAYSLGQTREFVLTHPEFTIDKRQETIIDKHLGRRISGEPIAYILGHKEFYGLDFAVNKHTLVPRPETELLVELALNEVLGFRSQVSGLVIADIGTGSGNIITSLAKTITSCKLSATSCKFFGIDISKDALKIARKNAKTHNVDKKIKFLHGDLLTPLLKIGYPKQKKDYTLLDDRQQVYNQVDDRLIIIANLPYLSSEIYRSAPKDVRNFEPKTALYSPAQGLSHYKKLLHQLKKIVVSRKLPASRRQVTTSRGGSVVCFFEISPEQKPLLTLIVKKIFPKAKITFHKDLAGKWRVCEIKNQNAKVKNQNVIKK